MVKEIGSEFWDIPIGENNNDIFPTDTKWFLSGRTALKYIIQDCNIKSIALPRWCCSSMVMPFIEAGITVSYYDETADLSYDAVFVIDYFGYAQDKKVPPAYSGIVIRDITHSLFSIQYKDADYYFGSLRKWAGFWTGGFAWGNWNRNISIPQFDEHYVSLRKEAFEMKKQYIDGKIEEKGFLSVFEQANCRLSKIGICGGHPQDIYAAQHLDTGTIKTKRRKNAEILLRHNEGIFELRENDCPLFVPILSDNRDALRKYLIDHEIYCPVHWPHWDLAGKELSLVCDQRYDEEDMLRVCECIKEFYKGNL